MASGVSGDLAYACSSSTGCAPICSQDLSLARLLCTLADSTHGNPALMLQQLLGFTAEDHADLLSALSESGCSYVDILAAYLHNLRVMTHDAAADPAATSESLQQRISDMHTELVADMVRMSLHGPTAQPQQQQARASFSGAAKAPAPPAAAAQDPMALLQSLLGQAPVIPAPAPAMPANMDILAQLLANSQPQLAPAPIMQQQQPECLESALLQMVQQAQMQQMLASSVYLMPQPAPFAHCGLQMPQQQLAYAQLLAAQQPTAFWGL